MKQSTWILLGLLFVGLCIVFGSLVIATRLLHLESAIRASQAKTIYVCDGIDDQKEIQAAIEDARASGKNSVIFSPGNFNLSDTVDTN